MNQDERILVIVSIAGAIAAIGCIILSVGKIL